MEALESSAHPFTALLRRRLEQIGDFLGDRSAFRRWCNYRRPSLYEFAHIGFIRAATGAGCLGKIADNECILLLQSGSPLKPHAF
jgi:hypothetical protein